MALISNIMSMVQGLAKKRDAAVASTGVATPTQETPAPMSASAMLSQTPKPVDEQQKRKRGMGGAATALMGRQAQMGGLL